MNFNNVVIIEDNFVLAQQMKDILHYSGYVTHVFHTAEEFLLSKATLPSPCVYLMDLNLPGLPGIDLIKVIRHHDKYSTIFVISGEAPDEAFQKSFSAGADDFIAKPFNPEHLILKVKNAHTKLQHLTGSMMEFGVKLVPEARLVSRDGNKQKLTNREYTILEKLLSMPTETFERDILIKELRDDDVTLRTIDVHVSSLRRKISKLDLRIETIRGKGYRIMGENLRPISL